MSLLVQAKREAKRLLKLSQENSSAIKISSLSEARKYYAAMKGYHSWHDYEENLKRQEFIKGIEPSNDFKLLDVEDDELNYYLQDNEFIVHLVEKNPSTINIIDNKIHSPSILGVTKKAKRFHNNEKWLLNSYPCTIIGTTGSGRTESWLSQAYQWIANGDGFIGVDSKGSDSTFFKLYQVAKNFNREKDVLLLSLIKNSANKYGNSIDIINPLIGNLDLFKNLFGNEIGELIHEIASQCKENNMLIDSQNIKSILMINNLLKWKENKIFGEHATKKINAYLENSLKITDSWDILDEELKDDILFKHADFSRKTKDIIEYIKQYEDLGIFSKTPEIDLRDVFLNKKILFILLPSLEKNWNTMQLISNSIVANIWKMGREIEQAMQYKPCFLQNVVLEEVSYSISSNLAEIMFKKLPSNTNFIFTFQDFYSYNNNTSILHALSVSKTIVLMRIEDIKLIPLNLKGRIVENVNAGLSVLNKNNSTLRELREGEAYVYTEVDESKSPLDSYQYKLKGKILCDYPKLTDKDNFFYKDFYNSKEGAYFEHLKLSHIHIKLDCNVKLNHPVSTNRIVRTFPLSELIQ